MSVKVSALCWRVRLPSTAKFVLIRLADYANDAGKRIFPAISTVAEECGMSHRSVQNAFKALSDIGVLVLERASKGGRGHTSVYSLDLVRIADLAVSGHGGPVSGQANGLDHSVNHAPAAGFEAPENHASAAGFGGNHATGAQNHAPAAPNPSLTVNKEEEEDARARIDEVVERVAAMIRLDGDRERCRVVVTGWLKEEADPDVDIFPVVADVLNRTKQVRIRTFGYFTEEIANHRRERLEPKEDRSNVEPIRKSRKPDAGERNAAVLGPLARAYQRRKLDGGSAGAG